METAGSLVSGTVILLIAYVLFFGGDDKVLDRIIIGMGVAFIFIVGVLMAVSALFAS